MDLSRELSLHLFNPSAVPQPALRRGYNATQVLSRRRLSTEAIQTLRRYGERIRVMELQGPLLFSTFEPVIRNLVRQAPYCQHVILNFRHVVSTDAVSLRLLFEVQGELVAAGVRLLCCHCGRFTKLLNAAGVAADTLFESEDAALESCEDGLLAEVMSHSWQEPQPVVLNRCTLFADCDEEDVRLLQLCMPLRSYLAGETIIHTGSIADELLVILVGTVEVCLRQDGSRRQRIDVLSAGMCFGELAFMDGSPRSADVIALEPVRCRVMSRELFEALDLQRPGLKIKILAELSRQLCTRLRLANIEIAALRA
jgi:glutaminase